MMFKIVSMNCEFLRLSSGTVACIGCQLCRKNSGGNVWVTQDEQKGKFRILDIGKRMPVAFGDRKPWIEKREQPGIVREKQMKPDQNWEAVWPAARTFHPDIVPLPMRQGVIQKLGQVKPSKKANLELMKIPNFMHLTPPVVDKHCQLIKQYTTKWPDVDINDLEDEYPVLETNSTFIHASSSIRDLRARKATISVNLDQLELAPRQKDKIIRLARDRYRSETNTLTITSDSCPHRQQNSDYCHYLLTALYFESNKCEPWEDETFSEEDLTRFAVPADGNPDAIHVVNSSDKNANASVTDGNIRDPALLQPIMNAGESSQTLDEYKASVLKHLCLKNDDWQPKKQ